MLTRVPTISLSSLDRINDRLFNSLGREAAEYTAANPCVREFYRKWDGAKAEKAVSELSYLSPLVLHSNRDDRNDVRSRHLCLEYSTSVDLGNTFWECVLDADTEHCIQVMEATIAALTEKTCIGVRNTGIRTELASNGFGYEFGTRQDALDRFKLYLPSLGTLYLHSRPKAAVAALVCLSNCHLFNDGNGRLSRVIFCSALSCTGSSYLPLCLLEAVLGGPILYQVRRVEWADRWEELVVVLARMIDGLRRLL